MKRALVVGINNYSFSPLRSCINDAKEVERLLSENEDGSPNFDVKLYTNVPRKSRLMAMITKLFSVKRETALFYFSGHGYFDKSGGFLLTPDDEGISMNDILMLANASPTTNKIIILDCCHSGAMAKYLQNSGAVVPIGEGVTILTASGHDEGAKEVSGKGVFTNLLTQALEGGAADITGQITPGSVYAYIDQALGPWDQRPLFKANISRFIPLRSMRPRISLNILRMMPKIFAEANEPYPLTPAHEYTSNNPDEKKVQVFKTLQKMVSVGLVEPVGEEYMYHAAMNGKACRLTPLGAHYWRLANKKRI